MSQKCFGLRSPRVERSEEHTSELQSRQYLHSFPTRRSSDLIHLRVRLGQVQAAIWRQAFKQDVAKVFRAAVAAGGEVFHQASSSLRMRVIGCSTLGRA